MPTVPWIPPVKLPEFHVELFPGERTLKKSHLLVLTLLLAVSLKALFVFPGTACGDHGELVEGKKILVVASYHEGYKWCDEIITTLEHELAGAEITTFYMDSKRNLAGAEAKAKEAYALYRKLQPDAVFTIDDNAQAYFVVPYLRDKVETPVIFCGVNDDAAKYGFPAGNVTGVLEKKHYRESISFAQIIQPTVRTVAVLYRPTPSNAINLGQIEKEKETYSANVIAALPVHTVEELRKALRDYAATVDAFLILNLTGITDEDGAKVEGHDAIALTVAGTDLVTIGASDWEIEAGALCGVIKSGEEQATLAAHQLVDHWSGTSIQDLPILQNKGGQRFINLNTMEKLHIELRPEMVIGTRLITGQ
jgi:ABC-type uncharacterized transport system substrate-binding protein